MNFLAHFHVGPPDADSITGAFLGDFVRGRVEDHVDLPKTMRDAIVLHRMVDSFTDSHPIWQRSAGRLHPDRRRLSGIVVDIIYDHYLCRHWEKFSDQPLRDFSDHCYECLLSRAQFMEEEPRRAVRRMRQHDWLKSYQQTEGIALAFRRLSYRSKALKGIQNAKKDFLEHYEALEGDFLEYYPLLLSYAQETWETLQKK